MADRDDFDAALEEAIESPDREPEFDLDDADDADAAQAHGGGDIDDEAAGGVQLDAARNAEAQVRQAADVREQWKVEHDRREAALKELQSKYLQARKDAFNGSGREEDEIAAQDAVLEARYLLDKARDSLGQAEAWHESVANAPRLAPAQQAWLESNPRYNSDGAFQKQAQQHIRALAAEGLDPTHPTFYRKLDDRMRTQPRMGRDSKRTPGAPAIRTSRTERESANAPLANYEAKFIASVGYDPREKRVADQWRTSLKNTKRIARQRGFL